MKYIGWGVMILGAGAAVLSFASMMQTLSAFGSSFGSFGNINTTLLLPVLISSVVMFCGAAIVGVTYLAFGELIKAFIDIAFCSLYTAQKVTAIADVDWGAGNLSGVKDELMQMTAVLREVNANTQKTSMLLEQATQPRPAAK